MVQVRTLQPLQLKLYEMQEQIKIDNLFKLFDAGKDTTYKSKGIDKMLEYAVTNGLADRQKFVTFLATNKIAQEKIVSNLQLVHEYFFDSIFSNRNYARLWVTLSLRKRLTINNQTPDVETDLLRNWCNTFDEVVLPYPQEKYYKHGQEKPAQSQTDIKHIAILENPKYNKFDFFKQKIQDEETRLSYITDLPINTRPIDTAVGFKVYMAKEDGFVHIFDETTKTVCMILEKDFPQNMRFNYFSKKCLRIK